MRSAESRFIKHEPCPKCGSKDNLGIFDDGHKWCFGCHYYVPSKSSIEGMKKYLKQQEQDKMGGQVNEKFLYYNEETYSDVIPQVALIWLRKYGITDKEIKYYRLKWNKETDSLVFPVWKGGGLGQDLQMIVTNERYFGTDPDHPKYKTRGPKTKCMNIFGAGSKESVLVCVEDMVSAMRVARQFQALPLLGSDLPLQVAIEGAATYKHLRVWLDRDKAAESVIAAARASQYAFSSSSSIITELDPKEYDDSAIEHFVKSSLPS
jgi:hypothetical protein